MYWPICWCTQSPLARIKKDEDEHDDVDSKGKMNHSFDHGDGDCG